MKQKQLTMRLTARLDRAIGKIAKDEGLTKAAWARQVLIRAVGVRNGI